MSLDFNVNSIKFRKESKAYLIFVLVGMIIAYLFYSAGIKAYQEISLIMKSTEEIEKDINTLDAKIVALKSFEKNQTEELNVLNVVFQSEDPSLFMFSTLKELSNVHRVQIVSPVFSKVEKMEGVSKATLAFSTKGIKEDVYMFMDHLYKTAPLSDLGEIRFSDYAYTGGEASIDMSVGAYYSPLPEVLPDTKTGIRPLNDDEKAKYSELIGFEILSKSEYEAETARESNDDPFSGYPQTLETDNQE